MKKLLVWSGATMLLLCALALGGTWALRAMRHADAAPDAIAATRSDDRIVVGQDGDVVLRPVGVAERLGVIVYPGAFVDVRGYVPTLRPVAAAGYRVVIVRMPLEMAFFGLDRALDVQARHADVSRWVVLGHSAGGAAAAAFASRHPQAVAGVIIWDSYPPGFADLARFQRPVWHIHRATPDGAPPAAFAARRALFPAASRWVPIPGGIHMYFGSFSGGGYREDWAPSISRETARRMIVDATLAALLEMERKSGG